jgi:hypothetical protein
VSPSVLPEAVVVGRPVLAVVAGVRLLARVLPLMDHHVTPVARRVVAESTGERLNALVHRPHVVLHGVVGLEFEKKKSDPGRIY